jgi:hypothetical protein
MLGAHDTAPLATQLVAGGVPIVLAMAGRISDLACRLFVRRFVEALVEGAPLARAVSEARRAAFAEGEPPHKTTDWAFPALFLSPNVGPGYVPMAPGGAERAKQVQDWIDAYRIEHDPVFCGRDAFFDAQADLFGSGPQRVLAIFTESSELGLGRTRLLYELARQALRDGHVPVIVEATKATGPPRSLKRIADRLRMAIADAATNLQLDVNEFALRSQLQLLLDSRPGAHQPGLKASVSSQLPNVGGLPLVAVSRALQEDLAWLVLAARTKHEFIREAGGQAAVFLDDVDQYGAAAKFVFELVGPTGLGTADIPVPVMMTLSIVGDTRAFLWTSVVDRPARWVLPMKLQPFQEKIDEDMLACELVLLHPFNKLRYEGTSGERWAINVDADEDLLQLFPAKFRKVVRQMPANLASEAFYAVADLAQHYNFLIPANDNDLLRKARE